MSDVDVQFYRKNFYYFYDMNLIKKMFKDEHLFPPGTIEDFYKLYVYSHSGDPQKLELNQDEQIREKEIYRLLFESLFHPKKEFKGLEIEDLKQTGLETGKKLLNFVGDKGREGIQFVQNQRDKYNQRQTTKKQQKEKEEKELKKKVIAQFGIYQNYLRDFSK
mgnify:CR=1 FL=1